MAKEDKSERAAKDPAEVAAWLREIEERLLPLKFGRIVINVYRGEIAGISVTEDVRRHERAARVEPPMPACDEP